MNQILIIIIISSFLMSPPAYAEFSGHIEKMQEAPAGFSWKWMEGAPIAFLVPEDWYFYSRGPEGTFITKENVKKERVFKTGLTFALLSYEKEKFSSPEDEMKALISYFSTAQHLKILDHGIDKQANSVASDLYWIQYEKEMPFGPITVRVMYFYDRTVNTILSVMFESPKEDWEEAKKIGNQITQNIFVAYDKLK